MNSRVKYKWNADGYFTTWPFYSTVYLIEAYRLTLQKFNWFLNDFSIKLKNKISRPVWYTKHSYR